MTRAWRPRPLVQEHDGEALWAGPLPDGPIVRLDDMAALLLNTLIEEALSRSGERVAFTSGEVLDGLRDAFEGLPADAEEVVERFFVDLETVGLVERVADSLGVRSTPAIPSSANPGHSESPA